MNQLNNRVALVTGANRGIGRAILIGALERGARKVYAAVRNLDSVADLVAEYSERVVAIHLDLEDPQSILDAAKVATDVDLLVNNAGVLQSASALAQDAVSTLEHQIKVNTSGLVRIAQAFAPVLKNNGGGTLAQLNSIVSIKTFTQFATYSASKAASYSITQSLREELAPQGTQVVSIHPGPIATDMGKKAGFEEVAESPEVVVEALFGAIQSREFHVFPDTMAKEFWQGYQSYAKGVIEPLEALAAH